MTRTPALALRASVAVLTAFALAACTPAAPAQPEAPAAPSAAASTAAPTAGPAPTETGSAEAPAFESQDGAVRFTLPEGWSVDDRSAMGEASEMQNRGPGWLNDLVVLDAEGEQMLWYREYYGSDFAHCYVLPADVAEPVDPLVPELRERLDAEAAARGHEPLEFQLRSGLQESIEWNGETDVPTGEWTASLALTAHVWTDGEDCGWTEEVWVGDRTATVGAVGDRPGPDSPASPIVFGSEQAARDWLAGDEAAVLLETLESIEFTGAPMLDAAP
ncbi:hypothetical protein SAMN04487783_0800 [Agrococcus baldri]|uniref:Lipoprotein n=1 Tax=Agrococcus baldri TaxID=153730 RepID=A0AA94HL96_9MICO|nr:hypothetical protein [Agrococcus baldri]SFS03897.1 hypothetical protein SAMN04487783_0800 [Agrococcus baldri]